jgi:small subunit ribosomal protein S8e
MAVWQDNSKTKKTGGRTRDYRKNKKHQLGSEFSEPEVGERKTITKDVRGGDQKTVSKRSEKINVAKDGEVAKADIKSVEDNPANPNYVRRSLLTKGAIIETSEGTVRITSRPGQEGVINGELVE